MQNYKFVLEYDGTRYSGWQKLGNDDNTIQGKLEQVLSRMAGMEVQVIGAGRTDAGVHARGQAANACFQTDRGEAEIRSYVNHYLPEDIRVLSVEKAALRFHSRYHAVEKEYCYTIFTGEKPPVFDRKYVYRLGQKLDTERMQRAAEQLIGTHDFRSFCGNRKMKKSTVRTIREIIISADTDGETVRIIYRGDGFLQYMIRILTGTLIEVGRGERDPLSMEALIRAKDRELAGYTAPPGGLCLVRVSYPEAAGADINIV